MNGFLEGFEILAFSYLLCPDCGKRFNELLEGKIDELVLCKKCKKSVRRYEETTGGRRMLKKHLFKKQCAHDFEIIEKSNAIQFDQMGYPLRLFICKCRKCGTYDQKWIDVPVDEANEIDSGKSFELKWIPFLKA